jgi:hypothetical protein
VSLLSEYALVVLGTRASDCVGVAVELSERPFFESRILCGLLELLKVLSSPMT